MANLTSKISLSYLYFLFMACMESKTSCFVEMDIQNQKSLKLEYGLFNEKQKELVELLQSHEQAGRVSKEYYEERVREFITFGDSLMANLAKADIALGKELNKNWENLKFGLRVYNISDVTAREIANQNYEAGYEDGLKARFNRRLKWNND